MATAEIIFEEVRARKPVLLPTKLINEYRSNVI
jgi:hypothetical protein